mmetsp:Transcript_15294/g.35208  ORF Transcript_15294/g.35208 Transcript_15294/m.35208 type:complete len:87 (+) Transcript_15294:110-370(+)
MSSQSHAREDTPASVDLSRYRSNIRLFVNGKAHTVQSAEPSLTLLEWLRGIGLCGTKLGCGNECTSQQPQQQLWRSSIGSIGSTSP